MNVRASLFEKPHFSCFTTKAFVMEEEKALSVGFSRFDTLTPKQNGPSDHLYFTKVNQWVHLLQDIGKFATMFTTR